MEQEWETYLQFQLSPGLIEGKCYKCNNNCQNKFDDKLNKRFFNTCKFSDLDINNFILLFQKGAYPYDYMSDWEKLNEALLPK